MTVRYNSVFFYGINLSNNFNTFQQVLLSAFIEVQPNFNIKTTLEYLEGSPYMGEHPSDAKLRIYLDGLEYLTKLVDKHWAGNGDPICIHCRRDSNTGEYFSSLCIRKTIHSTEFSRGYIVSEEWVAEEMVAEGWDHLLRQNCEQYQIPPTDPTFVLITDSRKANPSSYCIYGIPLKEDDLFESKLVEKYNEGVYWSSIEDSVGNEIFVFDSHDGWLYLGLKASLIEGWSETKEPPQGCGKLAAWKDLLKAKCNSYGIRWKEPCYHLITKS